MELIAEIYEDLKFNAAFMKVSFDEMENQGFALGDSVDLRFSNGVSFEDVPFFNGYFVPIGSPVLVAYPGIKDLIFTLNIKGIWKQAGFKPGDSVKISLNMAGKYAENMSIFAQKYSFDRADYESDESFSNFRPIEAGDIKKGMLFRGATPIDNCRGRANYTDKLLEKNNINYVIDLADSHEDYLDFKKTEEYSSDYFDGLLENNKIELLDLSMDYELPEFKERLGSSFISYSKVGGPLYIHCTEGKDRTGFVCLVVGALCHGTYEQLMQDYMHTYENYYGFTQDETAHKYQAVVDLYFNAFIKFLHNGKLEILDDYSQDARRYLYECGMTDEQIDAFVEKIV